MAPLTFTRLRRWNLGAGLLQLVTGVVVLGITPYGDQSKLPWYTFFIASWSRDDDPDGFYRWGCCSWGSGRRVYGLQCRHQCRSPASPLPVHVLGTQANTPNLPFDVHDAGLAPSKWPIFQ
jgi:hypothetical protein